MFSFLLETFALGLKNLRLHKLRSLLTAMGIILGVAAVIVMVAIGEGAKREALEQLQQLGAKNILVRSTKPPESNEASGRTQRTLTYGLKRTDFERLKSLPDLAAVVPLRDTEQKVTRGDVRANANAIGTTPQIFGVINLRLARGQFFDQLQYDRDESVCVIGHLAAKQLFPYEEPIGQQIRVGTANRGTAVLTVIGVLEPTGLRAGSEGAAMMQRDLDLDIYFPLKLAHHVFGDMNIRNQAGSQERKQIELTEVWLQARSVTDVEKLSGVAENVVAVGVEGGKRNDVEVKAPIQILRNAERLNKMFNFIMVGIASFSLVVGGIGIMNIMLATVTERTREIGIRRALGAKRWDITFQFLIEAMVQTTVGGVLGTLVGMGLVFVVPWVASAIFRAHLPAQLNVTSIFLSMGVSVCVGVFFGLYPAFRASRLDPIEALRHD